MKKKVFALLCVFVFSFSLATAEVAFAKPERKAIKSKARKSREVNAKKEVKKIRLKKIQDPEARKAIRQIMNYLDLPIKK